MDNCCCYTPTNSCLNGFRYAVITDTALFLVKIGAAIYFLVIGIDYKIKADGRYEYHHQHTHYYASKTTIGLYIAGGVILLLLILLRLICNRLLYNDVKHPENIMRGRSNCFNILWLLVTGGSLAFSCAVVAISEIPILIRLCAWISIVLEPLMFVMVLLFYRFVRKRFNLHDADSDSNYN